MRKYYAKLNLLFTGLILLLLILIFFELIIMGLQCRLYNVGPTSTSSIYDENKSQSKAVNLIPSIVIEHISSSNRNIEFIKILFISVYVDPNTIKQLSFSSHFCNIILSYPFASDTLLKCRSLLEKCPLYDKLFIRRYLECEVVKIGRLFYHVFKSELLVISLFLITEQM